MTHSSNKGMYKPVIFFFFSVKSMNNLIATEEGHFHGPNFLDAATVAFSIHH